MSSLVLPGFDQARLVVDAEEFTVTLVDGASNVVVELEINLLAASDEWWL